MTNHITNLGETLELVLAELFDVLINVKNSHWAVSRPMLVFLYMFPQSKDKLSQLVIGSQSTNIDTLTEAFSNLNVNRVGLNFSPVEREKFAQQVRLFRQKIKDVLDFSSLYKIFFEILK